MKDFVSRLMILALLSAQATTASAAAKRLKMTEHPISRAFICGEKAFASEEPHQNLDEKTGTDLELGALYAVLQSYATSQLARERMLAMIVHPLVDAEAIRQRQQTIQWIADNEDVYENLKRVYERADLITGIQRFQLVHQVDTSRGHFSLSMLAHCVQASFALAMHTAFVSLLSSLYANPEIFAANSSSYWPIVGAPLMASFASFVGRPSRFGTQSVQLRVEQSQALSEMLRQGSHLRPVSEIAETFRRRKSTIQSMNTFSAFNPLRNRATFIGDLLAFTPLSAFFPAVYYQWNKFDVIEVMAAVTELEVYYAFAKYYREHRSSLVFPKTLDTEKARLQITNGHNPVQWFKKGVSIANSIELDEDRYHTYIITGPNAGGKTTFQQMYLQLALMHQLGLPVPADYMEASPAYLFTNFTTNTGSIEKGESTFAMQARRAGEMLRFIQDRHPALTAMDEILTGTSSYEHQAIERAVLATFHEVPGSLTTLATHDRSLTSFADEVPGVANLQVSGVGFAVQPGASTTYNAFDIMERARVPQALIDKAQQYFAHTQACRLLLQTKTDKEL